MRVNLLNSASAASSTALSFTPLPGANGIVLGVQQEADTSPPTTVTFGGQSVGAPVASVFLDAVSDLRLDLYFASKAVIDAGTGSDFALTGSATETTLHAVAVANVSQATPIGNIASNSVDASTPNPLTAAITIASGAAAVAIAGAGNASLAAAWAADLVELTEVTDASSVGSLAGASYATGASKTASCTWSGGAGQNRAAILVIELLPHTEDYVVGDKFVFSIAGSTDTLTTRNGASFRRKAWGAGGAGGASPAGTGGAGGGGGFGAEDRAVATEETWSIEIGAGGVATEGGGQLTGIYQSTRTEANFEIIGGSGAGGGRGSTSGGNPGGNGGPGGGASGTNGSAGTGVSLGNGGTGGGTAAGGAGGTGGSGTDGNAGSALTGGDGGNLNAGGTGGAGRFGGGEGEAPGGATSGSGGGGGGSGKVTGTNTTLTAGSGVTPAGTADADYITGRGVGGAAGVAGGAGLIVIEVLTLAGGLVTRRSLLGVGI